MTINVDVPSDDPYTMGPPRAASRPHGIDEAGNPVSVWLMATGTADKLTEGIADGMLRDSGAGPGVWYSPGTLTVTARAFPDPAWPAPAMYAQTVAGVDLVVVTAVLPGAPPVTPTAPTPPDGATVPPPS